MKRLPFIHELSLNSISYTKPRSERDKDHPLIEIPSLQTKLYVKGAFYKPISKIIKFDSDEEK